MSITVFFAVILAALLHAVWNSIVKGGEDKALNMTGVVLGHLPISFFFLFFVPQPMPESWPYIISGLVFHAGYQLLLLQSYRLGDLTQVYPVARGTAPLLVVMVSVLFLGVSLRPIDQLSIVIIGAGILSLGLIRHQNGLRNSHAAWFAFFTGCFIAAYSLNDGTGARLAGTAIGFYCWLAIGNAIIWLIIMGLTNPEVLKALPRKGKQVFFVGGSASFIAYTLVIWSFTQAPIALVTALREISIVFALLIGAFFLGEKLNIAKVFSAMMILLGAMLMRFSS